MKNINELSAAILPVLFVLIALRTALEAIGPAILPLFAVAVMALTLWLWLQFRR